MSNVVELASSAEKVLMISSDGHATAQMRDYRPYLPPEMLDEFDAFVDLYEVHGTRNNDEAGMARNFDAEYIDLWRTNVVQQDRLKGTWDIDARLAEMSRAGLAAEVIFPDFGIPFDLHYDPGVARRLGFQRTHEQKVGAHSAFNRWLADWISAAPHRFAGMALVPFHDVDAALTEIRWAKNAGLKGVLLPMFTAAEPVFHPKFEPIWSLCEELEMPLNSHVALSGTFSSAMLPSSDDEAFPTPPPLPHPAAAAPMISKAVFYSVHQLLVHFVWGGVFEQHPNLQLVLTETGSAWVPGMLKTMDYTWGGSYSPRSLHDIVKRAPSEYFQRQVHLGSSVFSRAEMENRHEIGVDRMTLGMDFPHPEGTWGLGPGHIAYLNATLGAAGVPAHDARRMLGENAIDLWGFDRDKLQPVVDECGRTIDEILTVPEVDHFPRGDVHKPFGDPR